MNIQELENKIIEAAQHYYGGEPIMSDKEFDGYVEYLRAVNPTSQIFNLVGWGYDPYKTIGEKLNHLYGKVIGIERKPRAIEDIPNNFINEKVCMSAKLDGLSIVVYFVDGHITKVLTRGNGDTGINRIDKISKILEKEMNYPQGFDFTGAIRGEICISNSNWEKLQEIGLAGSNQRNTASGIINRDEILDDINYVDVIFYKVVGYNKGNGFYNGIYESSIMKEDNFDVKFLRKFIKPEYIVNYKIEDSFNASQNDLETLFAEFNELYPCDGVVITRDKKQEQLIDSKHNSNKYQVIADEIAYKFVTETAITEVEDVKWKLSKGNKLKPVIEVKPVELSGATVQRATAFNAKYVYDNDIGPGCQVELIRSGEVIPYITQVITGSNGLGKKNIDEMTCPFCGQKFEWAGVELTCTNPECVNRDISNLKVWVANIAQVDGISEKIIFKFFDEFNISSLEDLYEGYSYNDLLFKDAPENSHKGKFNKVLDKLYVEKIDLTKLLVGLNINMLGIKNAQKLANSKDFRDWLQNTWIKSIKENDYNNLDIPRLRQIAQDLIGDAFARNIICDNSLFKLRNITYVIDRIEYNGNIQNNNNENLISVVITGKLSIPRKKFEEYLLTNGYEVKGAITKDVKYLITDNPDSNSTKNKKASELGIEKITEEDIRNIINNSNH